MGDDLVTVFGLPAHPLLVHGVVVLVPLVASGIAAATLLPRVRPFVVWVTAALAAGLLVLTPLTVESGGQLEEQVRESDALEAHEDLGATMNVVVVGLAVAATGVTWLEVRSRRGAAIGGPVTVAVSAIALLLAAGATVQVVRVGHSGATAVWAGTAAADGRDDGDDGRRGSDGDARGDEDED